MNRNHQLVFNGVRGLIQILSESASVPAKGKRHARTGGPRRSARLRSGTAIASLLLLSVAAACLPTTWAVAATVTGVAGGAGGTPAGPVYPGGAGGTGSTPGTNDGGAGGSISGTTNYGANGQGVNGGSGGTGAPGVGGSGGVGGGYGGAWSTNTLHGSGGGGGSLASGGLGGGGGGGYAGINNGGGGGGGGGLAGTFSGSTTVASGTSYIGGAGGGGGTGGTADGGGGGGGAGILMSAGTLTNHGSITGGAGGAGTHNGGAGGGGGGGVLLDSGTALVNTGTITGGSGGTRPLGGALGYGGAGVGAAGNTTVTNRGTIAGGLAGDGATQADAVQFTGGGNTLIVESGATFTGNVVSTSGTTNGGDTLELGGSTSATLSGTFSATTPSSYSGTPVFSGFTTLIKSGTSTWTVTGASGTTTNAIHNWKLQSGTLTVANNYNPASTDTLTAAGGTLVVNGTANLNGQTLNVDPRSGSYDFRTQYNILHASTLSGTFGSIADTYGSYVATTLRYTGTDAYLTLNPTQAAFTSGQGVGSATWSTQQGLISAQQTVLNVQGGPNGAIVRVNGQPDPAVWVRGLAGTGSSDGAKLNENTALIGYGHEFLPGMVFGIALGNTDLHTKTNEQTVKTQGTGLYLYGFYNHQQVFVDATLTAGSLHTDSSRSLASVGLTATGSASGDYAGLSVNAGYRFYPSGQHLFVAPYVGAGYLHTHRNAYTESGAGLLDLSYSAADDTLSTVSAGARVGSDFQFGADNTLAPWMSLGETVYGGDRSVHQSVTLGSEQQVLPASGAPRSATVLDTGLTLSRGANWLTQLAYHGQYASGSHMNTADLKVVYRW